MIFDELDTGMRRFETSLDQTILPELYMAVRIDGRNFTKLTKETTEFIKSAQGTLPVRGAF